MIAYDYETPTCQKCYFHVSCQARVAEIRPMTIAIMDRYSRKNGRSLSWDWLTKAERKARKSELLDSSLIEVGLLDKAPADKRHAPLFKRAARAGTNPRDCSRDGLRALSPRMRVVVDRLDRAPATITDLAESLSEHRKLSDAHADRAARSDVSFLISMGRARWSGPMLELV